MSKEQGTISWCYARGRENPQQTTPPLTCGVRGSAAWKAFRRGQNDARVALKEPLPDAVGLAREGHRFIRRASQFMWSHPNLIQPDDVDCTDMDDERFEREVAEHGLPF